MSTYDDFKNRFKLLASKNQHLVINTLSNIFTMRLIGNKTHGDLAEIGMVEFINQFMYDFKSVHVGKDLFRAKEHEEDIIIINEITNTKFPVSLKAYGDGPLQLSTDSDQKMFPFLEKLGKDIRDKEKIRKIFSSSEFSEFDAINVMPLIYDEKKQRCNIMIFDHKKAIKNTERIIYVGKSQRFDTETQSVIAGKGRSHPIFMFVDKSGNYICEVRYGGASANALQRGLWTHTKNAISYFDSLTNGWIDYSHNLTLVKLFSLALNSTEQGHKLANDILQQDIFGKTVIITPKTEGIKYAGSKLKILPYIIDVLSELKDVKNVLDGFSGTTRVSQALAQLGYDVTSSDISEWSEVFATCYLKSKKPDTYYQEILDRLNNLKGYDGWYTEHYGAVTLENKKPFQSKNTRKLDAIRDEIEKLNLKWEDKCVILTSLIRALDSVDSTLGHYVAYLSEWSPRSHHDLFLKLPKRFQHDGKHDVIKGDIFETLKDGEYDLVYFDPPYGSNNEKMPPSRVRYASYYHIWTTIIKNDKPKVFGKANRREDSRDLVAASVFEEFRKDENGSFIAMRAIRKMIQNTKAKYILLSYSSGGRATKQELHNIINESGTLLKAIEVNYKKNVMANMRWTHEWINSDGKYHEYLFLMEKNQKLIIKPINKKIVEKVELVSV